MRIMQRNSGLHLYSLYLLAALALNCCAQPQPAPTAWEGSLPHSAKGYELYSWPAEDGRGWQHVLITGTNRLKTYEEIVSAENAVDESGWVSVSANGTEGLKALLSQLPDGESVTWIGGEWMEQMSVPRETIRLPDKAVIEEIERYCRDLGVELSVEP
ncbi:MAG: hypothetical protein PVH59_12825 [Anaerolineae bacterium]